MKSGANSVAPVFAAPSHQEKMYYRENNYCSHGSLLKDSTITQTEWRIGLHRKNPTQVFSIENVKVRYYFSVFLVKQPIPVLAYLARVCQRSPILRKTLRRIIVVFNLTV